MNKTIFAFLISMLVGLSASACERLSDQDTVVIGKGAENLTTEISKNKSGTVIRVELNGAFGGSGYQWENLTMNCPVLALIGSVREADSTVIGGPEKLIYYFCVRGKKGKVNLHFVLRRSWEKDVEPAQIFKHIVKVS